MKVKQCLDFELAIYQNKEVNVPCGECINCKANHQVWLDEVAKDPNYGTAYDLQKREIRHK